MILVTGHKGFVGQHLTKLLNETKVDWVGYDLKDGNDIRDKRKLDLMFESCQVDTVIHLAALAGVRRGESYPDEYITTNITGTHNLVILSEQYNVKHFIFYSSSSVYGESSPPVTEIYPKDPKSLYGITKLAGEKIVLSSKISQKTIVIPFTIYGENGRKDEVVYKWLQQHKTNKSITVYGDGSSERGYVYVKDLVQATLNIAVIHEGKWESEIFNLGGQEVIKLKDLINIFSDNIPTLTIDRIPMPEVDVKKNYANISRAKRILGFDPPNNFHENVERIIKKELYE